MATRYFYSADADGGATGAVSSDFKWVDTDAQAVCREYATSCVIFQQGGRNPPEPVAIWERSHD